MKVTRECDDGGLIFACVVSLSPLDYVCKWSLGLFGDVRFYSRIKGMIA